MSMTELLTWCRKQNIKKIIHCQYQTWRRFPSRTRWLHLSAPRSTRKDKKKYYKKMCICSKKLCAPLSTIKNNIFLPSFQVFHLGQRFTTHEPEYGKLFSFRISVMFSILKLIHWNSVFLSNHWQTITEVIQKY